MPVPAYAEPPPMSAPVKTPAPMARPHLSNPNIARGNEFAQVRVFYATDRAQEGGQIGVFGGARGRGLTYGSLFISIPQTHAVGQIERPSIWRLELSEDAGKHMVILHRKVTDADAFFAGIRELVARGAADASFLFVHGYNVGFDDAARRTAQITYDLNFAGAPVFYSWPSQASLTGYTEDENNVQWSEAHLKKFLIDYAEQSGAKDLYLIAHSMGNRALTGALRQLFLERPEMKSRFKEIILTAPDIDADIFQRDIAPVLTGGTSKVTLYVSDSDKALLASKAVHGYPRAGDAAAGITIVPGVETIDASGLDTSFLEHSYFAETGSVLHDIRKLVLEGLRAAQRNLTIREADSGAAYWQVLTTR
jgi:esterase/lipase superfamily enzyme